MPGTTFPFSQLLRPVPRLNFLCFQLPNLTQKQRLARLLYPLSPPCIGIVYGLQPPTHCLPFICLLFTLLSLTSPVQAHELQPGTLELHQKSAERYELLWRAPTYYNKAHPAKVQLPTTWKIIGEPTIKKITNYSIHRYVFDAPTEEVHGSIIRLLGLEATITDVFVRFYWIDGTQTSTVMRPSQPWIEIKEQQSALQVAGDYTLLGIDHILSGFDHLLFVYALLLIVSGIRPLLLTVTSFTIAHSMTLAAATLGFIWVPGPPVEAVIALSIVFLASELLKIKRGEDSLTARRPWLVAFVFGLLHGFGFAGALSEVGLPQSEVPLALLMFNVGVELGQLLFVAIAIIAIKLLYKCRSEWPSWVQQLPPYAIGSLAAFWLIERVNGFII